MHHTLAFVCIANLLLAGGTAAAADLHVAPGGGPGTFATIGAAVDAAEPGDRIFVAAGDYFEGFTVSKSLAILAEPGAALHQPSLEEPRPLLITELKPEDRVVISGLAFRGPTEAVGPDFEFTSIRALNNKGSIVLHALDIQPGHFHGLRVQSSTDVLLLDSALSGSSAADGCVTFVRPLVHLIGSTLYVANSDIQAASAASDTSPCPFAVGGIALFANYSKVVLFHTALAGGEGTQAPSGTLIPGSAITVSNTQVELRSSVARGGDGAAGTSAPGAIGAGVSGKSVLLVSQGSAVIGGSFGDGSSVTHPYFLMPGSTASATFVLYPRLEFESSGPAAGKLGQPLHLGLKGHPGDSHYLFLAPHLATGIEIPGVSGEFLLALDGLRCLARVQLDGAGDGAFDTSVPNDPALVGLTAFLQTFAPFGPTPAFGNAVLLPITG
ncbi:MAG: hypothetical protein GC161_00615 [Planctomycetaceae bacterium]|nr:hypothetical protein [Planctomycetaceae bacterium]